MAIDVNDYPVDLTGQLASLGAQANVFCSEPVLANGISDFYLPAYTESAGVGGQYRSIDFDSPQTSFLLPKEYQICSTLIDGYMTVEDDWDGYGCERPSLYACIGAKKILKYLSEVGGVVAPSPMLVEDGDVALYWRDVAAGLYVEIGATSEYTYYYHLDNGTNVYEDEDISIDDGLSGLLTEKLKEALASLG